MRFYNTVTFKSVVLTLSLIALYSMLIVVLVGMFPNSSPFHLALFAIDFSFVVFICIGFKILKPSRIYKVDSISTIMYFLIALLLAAIWFVYSPIVALNNKEWSTDLHFSSKSFTDVINNPISYKAYRFLKIILIGPILEELFYRKIILSSLLEKYSVYFSILLSSVLFSIGHMDFDYTIVFLVFGLLIGTFYWKTRNIYLTIVLHVFINSLTLFLI